MPHSKQFTWGILCSYSEYSEIALTQEGEQILRADCKRIEHTQRITEQILNGSDR